jgi:hypothetical protein
MDNVQTNIIIMPDIRIIIHKCVHTDTQTSYMLSTMKCTMFQTSNVQNSIPAKSDHQKGCKSMHVSVSAIQNSFNIILLMLKPASVRH